MNINQVLSVNLTPEQFNAATDPASEILCLACAGSGKSRTLAFRIARLIAEGASPESIVAFTFTEKAAESIKRRAAEALQKSGISPSIIGAMYIGTIHAYCKFLLGEMDAKYRQFEVLDPNRLKLYLISRYAALGLHDVRDQRTAIRKQQNPQAGRQQYFETIEKISDAWSNLNDESLNISDVQAENNELGVTLQRIYDGLNREEYIDYSLMIRLIVDALRVDENRIRTAISSIQHLMVDEYQDVNPAQEDLIRGIHQRTGTLFVVGDDDQAIYSWRGADVSNILTFQTRYPNASSHFLSTNFRSKGNIVDSSSRFIARQLGAQRMPKNPVAAEGSEDQNSQFGKYFFDVRSDEGEWVAARIRDLLGMAYRDGNEGNTFRGLCPSDFAILMKSTNGDEQDGSLRHSAYTTALDNLGIPYYIENQGSIFNFNSVRVLQAAFEKLRNNDLDRTAIRNFFDSEVIPVFPNAVFSKVSLVLSNWQREIHQPISGTRRKVNPQEILHEILNAFSIQNTSFTDLEMHAMGMFSKIMQDIESVYVSIDTTSRFTEILNFIENVADGNYETSQDVIIQRPNAVFISTIHAAKGLEFPVVFVVDVQAGRFPSNNRRYDGWLPLSLMQNAINRGAYQNNREGEIRVFYTAITRAERFLYLCGSANLPGGKRRNQRSVFDLELTHTDIITDPAILPPQISIKPQQQRTDETIMPTSFSEIKYYLSCPKNYQFRKQFGFNPHVPDLYGYGQTVHTAIAKLHQAFPFAPPSVAETEELTRDTFHLKHVPPSKTGNPGPYERALHKAIDVVSTYVNDYGDEFSAERQIEVRFEILAHQALITGSIDLLIKQDLNGRIMNARVVDFKSLEKPDEDGLLDWTELSIQVQLYARAAIEVLGQNARTGSVHLLRSNERINVPIDDASVNAAIANIEWAVGRIINRDFPMRPNAVKCNGCDFKLLCPRQMQEFTTTDVPPAIHLPENLSPNLVLVKAFSQI